MFYILFVHLFIHTRECDCSNQFGVKPVHDYVMKCPDKSTVLKFMGVKYVERQLKKGAFC